MPNHRQVDSQHISRRMAPETEVISALVAIEKMEEALSIITEGDKQSRIQQILKNWKKGTKYCKELAEVYPG